MFWIFLHAFAYLEALEFSKGFLHKVHLVGLRSFSLKLVVNPWLSGVPAMTYTAAGWGRGSRAIVLPM